MAVIETNSLPPTIGVVVCAYLFVRRAKTERASEEEGGRAQSLILGFFGASLYNIGFAPHSLRGTLHAHEGGEVECVREREGGIR